MNSNATMSMNLWESNVDYLVVMNGQCKCFYYLAVEEYLLVEEFKVIDFPERSLKKKFLVIQKRERSFFYLLFDYHRNHLLISSSK